MGLLKFGLNLSTKEKMKDSKPWVFIHPHRERKGPKTHIFVRHCNKWIYRVYTKKIATKKTNLIKFTIYQKKKKLSWKSIEKLD